jgi:hypothetical protein
MFGGLGEAGVCAAARATVGLTVSDVPPIEAAAATVLIKSLLCME